MLKNGGFWCWTVWWASCYGEWLNEWIKKKERKKKKKEKRWIRIDIIKRRCCSTAERVHCPGSDYKFTTNKVIDRRITHAQRRPITSIKYTHTHTHGRTVRTKYGRIGVGLLGYLLIELLLLLWFWLWLVARRFHKVKVKGAAENERPVIPWTTSSSSRTARHTPPFVGSPSRLINTQNTFPPLRLISLSL